MAAAAASLLPFQSGASEAVYFTNGFNPPRPVLPAARRGWGGRCPACGQGHMFQRWMEVRDHCPTCAEELGHARISNAVPVVAVPIAFFAAALLGGVMETVGDVQLLLELAACQVAGFASALFVLPRAKGLLIGLSWAHHVGGFDPLGHLLPDPERAPTVPMSIGRGV